MNQCADFEDEAPFWGQEAGLSTKERAALLYLSNMSALGVLTDSTALSLLYLANRESIRNYRYPIAPPRFPVGVHGVVTPIFSSGAETRKGALLDELSEVDIECLDTVWHRFGAWDADTLAAWMNNQGNLPELSKSGTISQSIMLSSLGVDDQNAKDLIEQWKEHALLGRIFDRSRL